MIFAEDYHIEILHNLLYVAVFLLFPTKVKNLELEISHNKFGFKKYTCSFSSISNLFPRQVLACLNLFQLI